MNYWKGVFCLTAASTIWGGMCVVGKYTTESIPPLTLVLLRFITASLVVGLIVHRKGWQTIVKHDVPKVMLLGFTGCTVSIGTQFMGIHWSSAHMAAVLTATTPLFIAVFAPLLLKEKIHWRDILSLAVCGIGMAISTMAPYTSGGRESGLGNVFLMIAAATWGLYSVLAKPLNQKYSASVVLFWSLGFGTLLLVPFTGVEIILDGLHLPHTMSDWFGIGYLGVFSTAAAFFCWNKGFEYMPAQVAGLFQFVQPVIGTLLAWFLLRETICPAFLYGSALILIGLGLSSLKSGTLSRPYKSVQKLNLIRRLRNEANGSVDTVILNRNAD